MIETTLDKLIQGRRSIRKYKPEAPPDEWIKKMILAAMKAPSPTNSQPVRFIRILSQGLKEQIRQRMEDGRESLLKAVKDSPSSKRLKNWITAYFRFSEFMFHAPVLFAVGTTATFVSLSERLFRAGMREQGHKKHRDVDIAVGLALKGYLLKGEDLGIGSCILTAPLIFIEEPETLFPLKGIEIKCFVTTGFPDEEPDYIKRKDFDEIYREI
ncbi:MAG TPA: nitroreductase family protein [Syntrophales bacterium]|nr:nitroreductase family protein [Syntrophales bacterium]